MAKRKKFSTTKPDNIWVSDRNVRKGDGYPLAERQELKASIETWGVLHPIDVVLNPKDGKEYECFDGQERLGISLELGKTSIPIQIHPDMGEVEKLLRSLESDRGAKHSPIAKARAYAQMRDEFGMSIEEIAQKVSSRKDRVASILNLLDLPDVAKEALDEDKISQSVAQVILNQPAHLQEKLADRAAKIGLKDSRAMYREAQKAKREIEGEPETTGLWVPMTRDKLNALIGKAEGMGTHAGELGYRAIMERWLPEMAA